MHINIRFCHKLGTPSLEVEWLSNDKTEIARLAYDTFGAKEACKSLEDRLKTGSPLYAMSDNNVALINDP